MKGVQILMMGAKKLGMGYIYNGDAAFNADFAPSGWDIPTSAQAEDFVAYVDYYTFGSDIKIADSRFWNLTYPGTNTYNFRMLGAGWNGANGQYQDLKEVGSFWVDTNGSEYYHYGASDNNTEAYEVPVLDLNEGHSVRLIYNGGGTPASTITDYDGNVYNVVQIGTQYWTASNWKCTKLNTGTALTKRVNETEWSVSSGNYYCAPNYNDLLV